MDADGPERGGKRTSWELLPAVALMLALPVLVLLAGLVLAVGVLLGKVDVGRR